MNHKNILKLAPGLMATGVLARQIKQLPKISPKVKISPIKKPIKLGIETIIGVGLVNATANVINDL